MASEYTLALKATLDTSDVQQKLNQLKQQQQGASGGNGGLGAGGIQQALQRLNTTLANLQRSIDKLSGHQGKQASTVGARGTPVVIGGRPLASATSRPSSPARVSPMALGAGLRSMQRGFVQGFDLSDRYNPARQMQPVMNEWRRFQRHGFTGRQLWNRLDSLNGFSAVEDWQAQQGSAAAFQSRLNSYRQQQIANNPILARERAMQANSGAAGMSRQMKANLRMGAGLAFGTIAGGVENYAQATGNQGLATGAGFVKNIGYGAAAGAMVGGPIGAVIGGSVGALNAAFDELARRARDTADALEDQAARVRSGRRFDIELKDFEQQRQDKEMLKKQTSGTSAERTEAGNYFRQQLDEAKKKYDNVRANMEKTGVDAEGGVEAYEKQTQKLLELRGKDDEEVKQRQKTVDIYKDQFYWLKKHSNRIEQLEDVVPKAPKAREFATSRFGLDPEKHPEIKDWTRYGAMGGVRGLAAAEQAKSLREALSNLKAPDMANVNSLASQGFMISAADDEARLDEANKHLTDLVNLTRQIKDKENEAATYG